MLIFICFEMYLALDFGKMTESKIDIIPYFIGLCMYSKIKCATYVPIKDYCCANNYKDLIISYAKLLTCTFCCDRRLVISVM